jgi:hypothetical protein
VEARWNIDFLLPLLLCAVFIFMGGGLWRRAATASGHFSVHAPVDAGRVLMYMQKCEKKR